MAITVKAYCERCGKKYERDLENTTSVHVGIVPPTLAQSINIIDLCPDCQSELVEWIEKGVNNE